MKKIFGLHKDLVESVYLIVSMARFLMYLMIQDPLRMEKFNRQLRFSSMLQWLETGEIKISSQQS